MGNDRDATGIDARKTIVGRVRGGEQLVLCCDDDVGLRAVIAIDDTTLGPGLGGVRLRAYPSEAAGVGECRRLAAAIRDLARPLAAELAQRGIRVNAVAPGATNTLFTVC